MTNKDESDEIEINVTRTSTQYDFSASPYYKKHFRKLVSLDVEKEKKHTEWMVFLSSIDNDFFSLAAQLFTDIYGKEDSAKLYRSIEEKIFPDNTVSDDHIDMIFPQYKNDIPELFSDDIYNYIDFLLVHKIHSDTLKNEEDRDIKMIDGALNISGSSFGLINKILEYRGFSFEDCMGTALKEINSEPEKEKIPNLKDTDTIPAQLKDKILGIVEKHRSEKRKQEFYEWLICLSYFDNAFFEFAIECYVHFSSEDDTDSALETINKNHIGLSEIDLSESDLKDYANANIAMIKRIFRADAQNLFLLLLIQKLKTIPEDGNNKSILTNKSDGIKILSFTMEDRDFSGIGNTFALASSMLDND